MEIGGASSPPLLGGRGAMLRVSRISRGRRPLGRPGMGKGADRLDLGWVSGIGSSGDPGEPGEAGTAASAASAARTAGMGKTCFRRPSGAGRLGASL
jgi:hypothetical protein